MKGKREGQPFLEGAMEWASCDLVTLWLMRTSIVLGLASSLAALANLRARRCHVLVEEASQYGRDDMEISRATALGNRHVIGVTQGRGCSTAR